MFTGCVGSKIVFNKNSPDENYLSKIAELDEPDETQGTLAPDEGEEMDMEDDLPG